MLRVSPIHFLHSFDSERNVVPCKAAKGSILVLRGHPSSCR